MKNEHGRVVSAIGRSTIYHNCRGRVCMIWGLGMSWRCSYVEAQLLVTRLTRKLSCLVAVRYIQQLKMMGKDKGTP